MGHNPAIDVALSTFGSPLSLAEDADLSRCISLGAWPSPLPTTGAVTRAIQRDLEITDRRWRGAQRATSGEFVPGDILRQRALAASWLFHQAGGEWRAVDGEVGPHPEPSRELALLQLLYAAVPHFLPAGAALGIMASRPPESSLVGDLRLPYPAVAVYFSEPFEVPDGLRGGEGVLGDRVTSPFSTVDVLAGAVPAPDHAPQHIRNATIGAYRGESLSIVGVVLTSSADGDLGDLVVFLVDEPAAPTTRLNVVEGHLDRSRLKPLIVNLAAAVTWGDWLAPSSPLELPDDPGDPEFRRAIRRGGFRRAEPHGVMGGVRVLDAPRMYRASHLPRDRTDRQDATAPATHLRRAHWHRYRVGSRDGWHYETRWIAPVVVNPGGPGPRRTTVYRLPEPDP